MSTGTQSSLAANCLSPIPAKAPQCRAATPEFQGMTGKAAAGADVSGAGLRIFLLDFFFNLNGNNLILKVPLWEIFYIFP